MKSIIVLFILTVSLAEKYNLQQKKIKSVSIRSEEHEKYIIKIEDEKYKIQNCENIEFLNLSEMNLQIIRNDIIRSEAIRHISLHNNLLKKVPQNILNYVTYLSCFNLSHNNINLYEDNEIRHPSLRILDLSYQEMPHVNAISEVEVFGEETQNYKHMIFNSSKMELVNLEYLDLSGNDISSLLWEFNMSFPKLIRLDLTNINAKELDPNFFDKIPTTLRVLHLENNHFRNLTLRNMAEIVTLHLDGNPDLSYFNIMSTKLRTLSLSNCTNLREGLLDTPYLEELDLSGNNLNNAIGVRYEMFRTLRVLLLDYNKFSYIPISNQTNMQWLHELSLRYNKIKYIKINTFQYLISLRKLSLKGNKIDHLEKETFSGLEKLEYLDLSNNQLSHLPSDWTYPLKELQYLNLNWNQFASISEMGVYSIISLQHLFVTNNSFTKITTLEMEPLPDSITIYLV